jgi:TonB family protein
MKVCPNCQASFAEGFVYCPRDAELLVRFDLRAQLRQSQARECNFLLASGSFPQRLQQALRHTWCELCRDPRGFCVALCFGEDSPQRRKYLLQRGAAVAVIAYSLIITVLSLFGLRVSLGNARFVESPPNFTPEPLTVRLILPITAKSEFSKGRDGHLGGSLPQPLRAQGGGGGGKPNASPASSGQSPRATLTPQERLPDPEPPKIVHPTLIQVPTIVADPLAVKFVIGPTGVPNAPPAPPSNGPGNQGGLGNSDGTGIGTGIGPGTGAGRNGNFGGGHFSIGGQRTTGVGEQAAGPRMANARLRPTILYREKAKYSEEAREKRVQGAVVLLVTFTDSGQITDIRVLRGQPHGLTEEAIQVAKRIRFQPAVENGVAVSVRAQLEYNFALY